MVGKDIFMWSDMMKKTLDINSLIMEAKLFCEIENSKEYPELLGITDGKAVGTFVEHKFKQYLSEKYFFTNGNSASGIDLPDDFINTDIKVTSIKQPQSSCPYKDSKQKIFGLGYNLLIFVYDKTDKENTSKLNYLNTTFVKAERTADFTITRRLNEMLNDGANKENIISYLSDRAIPGDDITLNSLADMIIKEKPNQGYLTISNALQWRLQYGRVISLNNEIEGVINVNFK